MHYHVIRRDYNTRTGQPIDAVGVGIGLSYEQAKAMVIQDEKQFRVPSAERWILHQWDMRGCSDGQCLPGPAGKGHSVR